SYYHLVASPQTTPLSPSIQQRIACSNRPGISKDEGSSKVPTNGKRFGSISRPPTASLSSPSFSSAKRGTRSKAMVDSGWHSAGSKLPSAIDLVRATGDPINAVLANATDFRAAECVY